MFERFKGGLLLEFLKLFFEILFLLNFTHFFTFLCYVLRIPHLHLSQRVQRPREGPDRVRRQRRVHPEGDRLRLRLLLSSGPVGRRPESTGGGGKRVLAFFGKMQWLCKQNKKENSFREMFVRDYWFLKNATYEMSFFPTWAPA